MKTKEFFNVFKAVLKGADLDLSKIYLAGGALRVAEMHNSPKDFDIYCEDSATRESLIGFLEKSFTVYKGTSHVTRVLGFSKQEIQIINVEGKAEEVVDQFDFTINSNYIYFNEDWDKVTKTYKKITELVPTTKVSNFRAPSLMRLIKFLEKGYTIDKQNLLSFVSNVGENMESGEQYCLQDFEGSYFVKKSE